MLPNCREHLIEESMVASWIKLQRQCNNIEVDQGEALAQVSLLVRLPGGAGLSLRFRRVHAGESFYRLTCDIFINRRKCQRPRSGGDVDV